MSQHDRIELPRPLVPPLAYLITLHVGLVPEGDHGAITWKVEDPTAEQLLGMGSCPHVSLAKVPRMSRDLLDQVIEAVFFGIEPF